MNGVRSLPLDGSGAHRPSVLVEACTEPAGWRRPRSPTADAALRREAAVGGSHGKPQHVLPAHVKGLETCRLDAYSRRVANINSVVARVHLDPHATSGDFVGVGVGLYAELDGGDLIEVDSNAYGISGPRRGLGAVCVRYRGDGRELEGFDSELFMRDPDEAITQALISSYRLSTTDIEDSIRLELFEGGLPAAPPEDGGQIDPERQQRLNDRQRDRNWGNLVVALREAGVHTTPAALRALPFRSSSSASCWKS